MVTILIWPQLPNSCAVTTMRGMQVTVRLLSLPRLGLTTFAAVLFAAGTTMSLGFPLAAMASPQGAAKTDPRASAQNSVFHRNSKSRSQATKVASSVAAPEIPASEFIVDAVVASVNGKPITLADVSARLGAQPPLELGDFNSNQKARQALDSMIFERLIEEEATNRKIRVTESEVDGYMDEVAKKNQMNRSQFETALRSHAQRVDVYREQVKADILRSRLVSQLMQQGAAVTEADIEVYLKEHPALTRAGSKVKLRQIVVSNTARTPEDALGRANEARKLIEDGKSFARVAEAYSDGAEASDGGSLGVVAEEELSPKVFEALLSVKEGEATPVVELPDGYRLFLVEKRYLEKEKEVDESILAEVRKELTENKLQERVQAFFTTDIMKLHTVDRKV